MLTNDSMRACARRWLLLGIAVVLGAARPAVAQDATPLELRPAFRDRAARPWLSAWGDLTSCTLVRCLRTGSLGVELPVSESVRIDAGATVQQIPAPLVSERQTAGRFDLFYDRGGASLWAGRVVGNRGSDGLASADARPGMEYGAAFHVRSIGIAANVGGGTTRVVSASRRPTSTPEHLIDLGNGRTAAETTFTDVVSSVARRWSSVEARLTWRADHWWLAARVGRVNVTAQHGTLWGGVQLGADVGRGASLVLGAGTVSSVAAAAMPVSSRNRLSLALRVDAALLSRSTPANPQASPHAAPAEEARTFVAAKIAAGRYRIAIRVPDAQTVEFASDCTGWQPVAMTRGSDGWVVEVVATPGVHQANIRIDGGKWIAPPGLTAVDDDFAGTVGNFSIQ